MNTKAIVTLCNPSNHDDEIKLVYNIAQSKLAQKWSNAVIIENGRGMVLKDNGWFHGFKTITHNRDTLARDLNEKIELINSYYPGSIPERAAPDMSQDTMNILHKYFEDYRGSILNPGYMWTDGNTELRDALERYNELIHRYEALINNEKSSTPRPRFSMMFVHPEDFEIKRDRYKMEPEDLDEFSMFRFFGQLYLHYCEVGKQVLDAFFDHDEVVGEDNIRPLKYYSACCDCFFGPNYSETTKKYVTEQLKEWLESRGMDINDKNLSIGYATLGTISLDECTPSLEGKTEEEIVDHISKFLYIKRLDIK